MTATLPARITEPGVYDLPDDVYHADPVPGGSLSASGAKKLLPPSCPAIFHYERSNPPKPKPEFDLGHAAHHRALGTGPDLVHIKAADWRTRAAREARDAAHAAGKVPLLTADLQRVNAMTEALRQHPLAGRLLDPWRGRPEQSLFWQDTASGVQCRARLDWLDDETPGQRRKIGDYKTAVAVDDDTISRVVHSYRYHLSAATYLEAVRALGLDDDPQFLFIFQMKEPPFLVNVVQLDPEAERVGRELWRRALDIYARCEAEGRWPSFNDGIAEISLPPWATRAHDQN